MVSPGDQWRSAITRQCLDSNRNTWGADIQRKPKTKRRDFNQLWQMKPANTPALLQVRGSETCLHARPMLLFSILSYGQQHVSLPFSFFGCCPLAGTETDKYISVWVMQSTHSQNNSGRSLCWLAGLLSSQSAHTDCFLKAGQIFFFKKLHSLCVSSLLFVVVFPMQMQMKAASNISE